MDFKKVLWIIVSPTVAGLIVILNLSQLGYIIKKGYLLTTKCTVFIVNLVCGNLLLGFVILSAKVVDKFASTSSIGDRILSYLKNHLLDISLNVSLLTIVCMTIEKLLAVKTPYLVRNLSKKFRVGVCLVVWFMTIGLTVAIEYNILNPEDDRVLDVVITASEILVSLPVETVCFVLILRALRDRGQFSETEKQTNYQEKKFVKFIMKTHISFVCCWFPLLVYGFLSISGAFEEWNEADYSIMNNISYIIVFVDSILNPLIYFHHHGFLGRICFWKRKDNIGNTQTNNTVSTSEIQITNLSSKD